MYMYLDSPFGGHLVLQPFPPVLAPCHAVATDAIADLGIASMRSRSLKSMSLPLALSPSYRPPFVLTHKSLYPVGTIGNYWPE